MLAVAAAEVGFREFASIALPDAAWLLESVQSPPLVEMLTELFPWSRLNRQIAGQPLKPPASAIEILKKAVLLRNNIVHGHGANLTPNAVASIIAAVGQSISETRSA